MPREIITGSSGVVGRCLQKVTDAIPFWGDIRKLEEGQFHAVDTIYHLAAKSDQFCKDNPVESEEVMVGGTLKVLEVAKKIGARVVFASSLGAKNPVDPYGVFKKMGEELCELYGNSTILRFANVYGGKDPYVVSLFIEAWKKGEKLTVFGDSLKDFIHAEDVANACVHFKSSNGIYEIGTGVNTSIVDLAQMISDNVEYKEGMNETRLPNIQHSWKATITLEEGITRMKNGDLV